MKFWKQLVLVSLIISWIIIGYAVVFGKLFASTPINQTTTTQTAAPSSTTSSTTSASTTTTSSGLTATDVATHNSSKSCYLIVNNKVYDVTTFLHMHPGGGGLITPYCGKEATQAFNTQGGRGRHSSSAASMLKNYYIGDLAQ